MNIQAKIRFRGNDHLNGNNNNWTFHWFRETFSSLGIFITGIRFFFVTDLFNYMNSRFFFCTLDTVYDNLYRIKMIAKANKEYY